MLIRKETGTIGVILATHDKADLSRQFDGAQHLMDRYAVFLRLDEDRRHLFIPKLPAPFGARDDLHPIRHLASFWRPEIDSLRRSTAPS
ncbi:hypothetical protein GGR39_003359 [Novosphingobium fluoreni]|uniref:Uncharacterized protein n=1 Tax=Novosphingobium fluoreni TaxID=1391222 RepID=A0A7W6C1C1_9SPHN|nr:hypothetical protein [Novosphingobium fluoreni]